MASRGMKTIDGAESSQREHKKERYFRGDLGNLAELGRVRGEGRSYGRGCEVASRATRMSAGTSTQISGMKP